MRIGGHSGPYRLVTDADTSHADVESDEQANVGTTTMASATFIESPTGTSLIDWHAGGQQTLHSSTYGAEGEGTYRSTVKSGPLANLTVEAGITHGPHLVRNDNLAFVNTVNSDAPFRRHMPRHLQRKLRELRRSRNNGEIEVSHIPTEESRADGFTKPLPVAPFLKFRDTLGVVPLSEQLKISLQH